MGQGEQIVDKVGPITVNNPDGAVHLRRVDMLVILPSRVLPPVLH